MTTTVTLDRTSLSLSPLVIQGAAPDAGFFLTEGGLQEPQFDVRSTYAPDSAFVAGSQLLAAVLTASTLPLRVGVVASDTTTLESLRGELVAALWQFHYTVTLTVNGASQTWDAGPCYPAWDPLTSGWVDQYVTTGNVVIPVNP